MINIPNTATLKQYYETQDRIKIGVSIISLFVLAMMVHVIWDRIIKSPTSGYDEIVFSSAVPVVIQISIGFLIVVLIGSIVDYFRYQWGTISNNKNYSTLGTISHLINKFGWDIILIYGQVYIFIVASTTVIFGSIINMTAIVWSFIGFVALSIAITNLNTRKESSLRSILISQIWGTDDITIKTQPYSVIDEAKILLLSTLPAIKFHQLKEWINSNSDTETSIIVLSNPNHITVFKFQTDEIEDFLKWTENVEVDPTSTAPINYYMDATCTLCQESEKTCKPYYNVEQSMCTKDMSQESAIYCDDCREHILDVFAKHELIDNSDIVAHTL